MPPLSARLSPALQVVTAAVQKAGLQGLQENQKIEYEVAVERGKEAAINLKPV